MTWTIFGWQRRAPWLAPALTLACAGCAEDDSEQHVLTSAIVMLAEVVDDGFVDDDGVGEAFVTVELKVGGRYSNTYASLDTDDEVIVVTDEEEVSLVEVNVGTYEGPVFIAGDEPEVSIQILRAEEDDARDNVGTLPAPFEITSEYEGEPISRKDHAIEVTWEPSGSGDDMTMEFARVGCFALRRIAVGSDEGHARLPRGELEAVDRDADPECLDATLTLARTRLGTVDDALDRDSVLRLRQSRTVRFPSGP